MSDDIINEHTEEKIKDYLSEEKMKESQSTVSDNFGVKKNNKKLFDKKMFFGILIFVIIISSLLFLYMRNKGKQSFDESRVRVSIEAPDIVSSGNEVIFELKYENQTGVNLKNSKISFFIPKEFIFISSDKKAKIEETVITWEVENILPSEVGSIKIFGEIYGTVGKEFDFNSKIAYYPDNFNYEFQSSDSESRARVKIFSAPFEVFTQMPKETMSGEEIELTVDFENISNRDYKIVNIQLQFTPDFKLNFSKPEPIKTEKNINIYRFEDLAPKSKNKIVIKGNYTNEKSGEKEVKIRLSAGEEGGDIFEYINNNDVIKVSEVPISVKQYINGSEEYTAVKGEELEYIIKFKNKSDSEIKGLVIKSKIEGEIDIDSLEVSNGSYDRRTNVITWSAFNVPKLALFKSLDEGEVSFKIKVKNYFEIKVANDKNFTINNNVKISNFNFSSESVNVEKTIINSDSVIKLSAALFVRTKGYFNDDGRIKNTGAIPPEEDKETTYLIHWYLSSLINEIKNLKISTILPEGVKWTGNYIKSNEELSLGDETNGTITPDDEDEDDGEQADDDILVDYVDSEDDEDNTEDEDEDEDSDKIIVEDFYYNTKTREIIWEIPLLSANTGIVSPAKEVIFQISIKPTKSDVGKTVVLINNVKAIGFDEFSQTEITTIESELMSDLPDDYSIGVSEGIVISNSDEDEDL